MSILLKPQIEELIKSTQLIITPLLDREQICESSVDVRLGNEFILIIKSHFPGLDLGSCEDNSLISINQYYVKSRIDYRTPFVLHPGQLVLGSTLEYIKLPGNIAAYVIGRSSLGRLGLVIATATHVAPGYCGTPTLEIVNMGEIPITVYPGIRIAQLVFHSGEGEAKYNGKHRCSTGPEFSKILDDPDLKKWTRARK